MMGNIPKGPKRVVRKRPLTSSFKPRPSAEIDDRPYMKKRREDSYDDRPRGPRAPRDSGGPPRGRSGPSRDFGGPPRGKGGYGDRKFGDRPGGRPYRDRDDRRPPDRLPYRDERKPNDNRVLLDTVKRLESGMTEVLERLARIEKELAGRSTA